MRLISLLKGDALKAGVMYIWKTELRSLIG